ncbi:hypothetical protein GCM10022419_031880 [Nonomuraea rosea]|uniref:Uncharacterized protein n=1 Tax=Nonomuraea rosea TaxID=638574 RepID=A0ABP6WBT8_9ACTN
MSNDSRDRLHQLANFSFQHTTHVVGSNPKELASRALLEATRFFGDDAEVYVVSAESEADPEHDGRYKATVVFRQVADGGIG